MHMHLFIVIVCIYFFIIDFFIFIYHFITITIIIPNIFSGVSLMLARISLVIPLVVTCRHSLLLVVS